MLRLRDSPVGADSRKTWYPPRSEMSHPVLAPLVTVGMTQNNDGMIPLRVLSCFAGTRVLDLRVVVESTNLIS